LGRAAHRPSRKGCVGTGAKFPLRLSNRTRSRKATETAASFMTNSPIIIALDVPSAAEARALVASLGNTADFYKVGLELYAAAGMDFVRELKGQGKRVFLDL